MYYLNLALEQVVFEIGRLFFESLGKARGAFETTKNQLYKNVDDILIEKGAKTTEVIPVNALKTTIDDIRSFYTEGGMPDVLAQRLGTMTNNIEKRAGKYSFSQLDSLRKLLVDDLATPMSRLGREQTGKLIKSIDDILTNPRYERYYSRTGS